MNTQVYFKVTNELHARVLMRLAVKILRYDNVEGFALKYYRNSRVDDRIEECIGFNYRRSGMFTITTGPETAYKDYDEFTCDEILAALMERDELPTRSVTVRVSDYRDCIVSPHNRIEMPSGIYSVADLQALLDKHNEITQAIKDAKGVAAKERNLDPEL